MFIAEMMKKEETNNGDGTENKMDQSFYRKEGIDYLYFQRPGTAYGNMFNSTNSTAMMGTQTRSGFFDASTKVIKPLEMISQKNKGGNLVQQLWFKRAQNILDQLEHLAMVFEFFEFCYVLANRFRSYLLETNGNKYEIKSFLELYETWQTSDYDMFQI